MKFSLKNPGDRVRIRTICDLRNLSISPEDIFIGRRDAAQIGDINSRIVLHTNPQ